MRLLFTIPHHFRDDGRREFGSTGYDEAERRALYLRQAILALHAAFGQGQRLFDLARGALHRANSATSHSITVIVCTGRSDHLLGRLADIEPLFTHAVSDEPSEHLGFACHGLLKDGLGRFDYCGYLEDDILVADPLLFDKLAWFTGALGPDCVLQPNRFEFRPDKPFAKTYGDGDFFRDGAGRVSKIVPAYNMADERRRLSLFGREILFQQPQNLHSGCFFLAAAQMALWAAKPYFLDRDTSFVGPLESAATLGLMRSFRVFKPALENANFLEVQHLGVKREDYVHRPASLSGPGAAGA
jgi:hypothetical protein